MKISRYRLVGLIVWLVSTATPGIAAEPFLTPFEAKNLNGDVVTIPTVSRTLLLIAFERGQQEVVDSWINGLDLPHSGVHWYEIPVIDDPGAVLRWVINTGMRDGIPDPARRAHVVTLFADRPSVLTSLGIADVSSCYALVIDSAGKILVSAFGHYDRAAAQKIMQQLVEKEVP